MAKPSSEIMPVSFLTLNTFEFLSALKRLTPGRITIAMKSGEIYIGKLGQEAIFSINGAQTRCALIDSEWEGFAIVNFGIVASFLKAPPKSETISLSYHAGRLKIDSLSLSAKWASAPDWIATMASEVQLMTVADPKTLFYCPRCGKRKGEATEPTARQWLLPSLTAASSLTREHANMRCMACNHRWCEIETGNA